MSNVIFCLMGPTAAGKTALASELLTHFPMEIISVDSAMIYRDMNIGTAKPTPEELILAPHHLINIKDPVESYSAAQFVTDTTALSQNIAQKGKFPLLVGGTMMYFHALQKGLSALPEANEAVRKQLADEAQSQGWNALHQKLMAVDPVTAGRIHAHDAQRIQRALEVYFLSGIPLSVFLAKQKKEPDLICVNLVLFPQERTWLHQRIEQRFTQMLRAGFVDEVNELKNKWNLTPDLPAMRCVGYRQILEYLQGDYDAATMANKGIAATRQLAKRQLTWLRSWDDALHYDPQQMRFNHEIIAKIREILDNESS